MRQLSQDRNLSVNQELSAGNGSLTRSKRRTALSTRYTVKLAKTQKEIESALRLRYEVFNVELAGENPGDNVSGLEYDRFDLVCRHLLVVDQETQETVGTYRLNTIETAGAPSGFYSFGEFVLEDLPEDVLSDSIEIGRACIAQEHRNTKVLFLLWKGLADHLRQTGKRYFFGCCSIFSRDRSDGINAFRQLTDAGFHHESINVRPRPGKVCRSSDPDLSRPIDLPPLFKMYLEIGAKICGFPVIDSDFGTIDFFVVCDVNAINEKYRRLFLN